MKNTNSKSTHDNDLYIVPSTTLKVNIKKCGRGRTMKQFVHTNGIIAGDDLCKVCAIDTGTLRGIMNGIVDALLSGYEVRFGVSEESCIRIHPMLNISESELYVRADAIGDFRHVVKDMKWQGYRCSKPVAKSAVKREAESIRQGVKRICVTPDTTITCPTCGTEIRVGRHLASIKD